MDLEPSDIVRVARLLNTERDVDSDVAEPPQPRVGETGTVVDSVGDGLYLVEHSTDDGKTIWIAEFHMAELELVNRGR